MTFINHDDFLQKSLKNWELSYRKGLIHFWILVSLREGKKSVKDMQTFIYTTTFNRVQYNEQTLYRVVRKYFLDGFIKMELQKNENGPAKKLYTLSEKGNRLLAQFIHRNMEWIYAPPIRKLLNC